ncbi:TylF/MycF/NovP-related O-methyltransferase [Geodermatophilus sp. URMC 61]|uniref:TylF/MycF/NovP-related O-methyltransferase n=1 Tax=Geodermatophilus sp. URMC 61 TaxID=3423411 RepID=UPI00406CA97A
MLHRVIRALAVRAREAVGGGPSGVRGDVGHDDLVGELEDLVARARTDLEHLVRQHGRAVEEMLDRQAERVIAAVHEAEMRERRDIRAAGERAAVLASARFAQERMPKASVFADPSQTLDHALRMAPDDGMALEFGVYTGGTLTVIAQARGGRDVFGFDSFAGLPEDWRSRYPAGAFEVDAVPTIPGAELVVGLFEDTLSGFLADHPGPVAFLHLDADLYSSTRTVLDHVGPRLHPGTVVLFDEYFNYAGWEEHEHRAWQEFVAASGIGFSYEGYTQDDEQVFVRVTDPPATASGQDGAPQESSEQQPRDATPGGDVAGER